MKWDSCPVLMEGDVLLVRHHFHWRDFGTYVGWAIRVITSGIVNHAEYMISPSEHVGASYPRVRILNVFRTYRDHAGKIEVAIFRRLDLTTADRVRLVTIGYAYEGRKYGLVKCGAHFGDWLVTKVAEAAGYRGPGVYFFRRFARMKNYPMCFWLVGHAFKRIGKPFHSIDVSGLTGDHLWTECRNDPVWRCMFATDGLEEDAFNGEG